ncbi:hypothetical protein ACFPRL_14155 [Pseudoclavibacter helvolus]
MLRPRSAVRRSSRDLRIIGDLSRDNRAAQENYYLLQSTKE